ncbi:hypothetical protein GCM10010116_43930 [Microbispora rosea subsp. aerata]|nr:hypothetical protein [Microbispora rosea]GGO21815.1 hypothetical protein GCM10010116_43930 [Microbispora rosea subsp. aerata]GIH53787.1 hypothetical protein Mro02_07010 [Microbispora rosea subsp. aerata]GLJ81781.1 hypothetical protein GCM10017588_05060 [Microbispora rosea subsp. aerata]
MTTTETTPGTPAAGTTGGTATAGATTTRSRTPRARTTTPRTPAPAPAPSPEKKEEHRPQLDLNLPFLRIQLRAPEMHMPHVGMPHISGRDVGHAMDVARTFLPPPERIMYYGGLGALAALGILEWPVAAAIGAGTMIAQRAKSREQRWSPLGAPQKETRGTAMPAPGARTTEEPAARATAGRRTTTAKSEAKTPAATAARRTKAGAK